MYGSTSTNRPSITTTSLDKSTTTTYAHSMNPEELFQYAETARKRIGLSVAQFTQLIGDPSDRSYERKLDDVLEAYGRFRENIRIKLQVELLHPFTVQDGHPYFSTDQVSRILQIGEFHVSNLRAREVLPSIRVGRKTVYKPADVIAVLDQPLEHRKHSSPLAIAFMRFVEQEKAERRFQRAHLTDTKVGSLVS